MERENAHRELVEPPEGLGAWLDLPQVGADGLMNLVGTDMTVIKLAARVTVDAIEIDTNHFKGNYPESALVTRLAHAR